jgi:hypothetical protein
MQKGKGREVGMDNAEEQGAGREKIFTDLLMGNPPDEVSDIESDRPSTANKGVSLPPRNDNRARQIKPWMDVSDESGEDEGAHKLKEEEAHDELFLDDLLVCCCLALRFVC